MKYSYANRVQDYITVRT